MATMSQIASQTSNASAMSSGLEETNKVKLRLCYGGRFEQTPSHTWRFIGGEYFNESISYGIKYADFMFKLSEKFRAAVSVKYQAPGEELDPDSLISVQDDADLQELVEDYYSHLDRPGTPSKTYRIKVFVFMAAEEPLTPDEIMEGQTFFSEIQHVVPPRVRTCRLDGRSSWGSTLSSTGTPGTRHPDMSTGDWLSSLTGQAPVTLPSGLASDLQMQQYMAAATAAGTAAQHVSQQLGLAEQDALDRLRLAVNHHQNVRLAARQQRLLHSGPAEHHGGYLPAEGEYLTEDGGYLPTDEHDDGLGENEESGDQDDADQLAEVIAAIHKEQVSKKSLAAPLAAGVTPAGSVSMGVSIPPASEASLPNDPWDMSDDTAPGPQQHMDDSRSLPALPSCISAFGQDSSDKGSQNATAREPNTETGAAVGPAAIVGHGRHHGEGAMPSPATAAGLEAKALDALFTAAAQLPSHISAFGDDLGSSVQAAHAPLGGSNGGLGSDNNVPANGEAAGQTAGAGLGFLRTQDSSFLLDGDLVPAGGAASGAGGRRVPERADSGDSLTSLPKLQPVHRLAKPDLKIVAKIGEGAFGEVSVASAPLYGTVAVKWLKSERFGKHFASFGREAALLADLNHPNVLRFYGVVTESAQDNTVIGIMTEYIRGGSMSAFLRMSRSLLPLRTRCELALAASNGLAYLHELRIVHFDLKPDNLLLDAPPAVVRAAAGVTDLEEQELSAASADAITRAAAADGDPYFDDNEIVVLGAANGAAVGGSSAAITAGEGGQGAGSGQLQPTTNGEQQQPQTGSRTRRGRSSSVSSAVVAGLECCEVPVVKVADFGLSKHKLNSTYVSSCRDLRGTLPYMAPELVADPERVCEKADVWSLGVVMWEMLTREIPFQDLAPQQILMGLMMGNLHLDVPEWCEPEWRGLLEACLEPNPTNRPSMRELARQLEAIRDQQLAHEQHQLQQHLPEQRLPYRPQQQQQLQQAVLPEMRPLPQQLHVQVRQQLQQRQQTLQHEQQHQHGQQHQQNHQQQLHEQQQQRQGLAQQQVQQQLTQQQELQHQQLQWGQLQQQQELQQQHFQEQQLQQQQHLHQHQQLEELQQQRLQLQQQQRQPQQRLGVPVQEASFGMPPPVPTPVVLLQHQQQQAALAALQQQAIADVQHHQQQQQLLTLQVQGVQRLLHPAPMPAQHGQQLQDWGQQAVCLQGSATGMAATVAVTATAVSGQLHAQQVVLPSRQLQHQ